VTARKRARRRRLTDEQRRANRLETYRTYNQSRKGKARYDKYEAAHPERAVRWEPMRNALAAAEGKR
jgi:hypothetical protein